jgi:hypothetical protein
MSIHLRGSTIDHQAVVMPASQLICSETEDRWRVMIKSATNTALAPLKICSLLAFVGALGGSIWTCYVRGQVRFTLSGLYLSSALAGKSCIIHWHFWGSGKELRGPIPSLPPPPRDSWAKIGDKRYIPLPWSHLMVLNRWSTMSGREARVEARIS